MADLVLCKVGRIPCRVIGLPGKVLCIQEDAYLLLLVADVLLRFLLKSPQLPELSKGYSAPGCDDFGAFKCKK